VDLAYESTIDWKFLEKFQVCIEENIGFYLEVLYDLKEKSQRPSKKEQQCILTVYAAIECRCTSTMYESVK
jgi:hypothetical protein